MSKIDNDNKIKLLMSKVEEKKKALGSNKRSPLNTNGLFKYSDEAKLSHFNLNTVDDLSELVNALAHLIAKKANYEEACTRLGIEADFKWNGYSFADWEADLKARVEYVQLNQEKKKLDNAKKKLDSLVSEEARTEMELETLMKGLGL